MIINPYLVVPGVSYDPDAQAFINATSISGSDANAINELVLDLKGANIWTKFNALYPIIGTTATQQKFNLKNPADTNAAYRLTFAGGWTHSATGATPNGTNAYANTNLIPNSHLILNSTHLSLYIRTNVDSLGYDIGCQKTTATAGTFNMLTRYINNLYADQYNNSTNRILTANSDSRGFYIGSRISSTSYKVFKNASQLGTTNTNASSGFTGLIYNVIIGALNDDNVPNFYSTRQYAFASIGSGLTDTESQLFYQIVEKYQVALGRNINPLQSFYYNRNYNNEANAYLFSTQISDTTQQVALNTLVSDMKTYGIWSKMKAVYPIMGTTATQQKFNLVNPQDTNAAYRLTFAGGWTHSSTGMTPNGTNAYANTFLNPNTILSGSNHHISLYSRTNTAANTNDIGAVTGNTPSVELSMYLRHSTNNLYFISGANSYPFVANSDSRGFFLLSKTTSTTHNGYKNNSKVASNIGGTSGLPTVNLFLSARNADGLAGGIANYSIRELSFSSIGDGLTDAEAANFYTAVQNFQTSLGRQV